MNQISTLTYAVLGGLLPALAWLWFWLREDKLHPEPRSRIALCFLGGMAAIFIVYPLQKASYSGLGLSTYTLTIWAAIEELAKYLVAGIIAFRSKDFDEPVDALIYMITAALGFSALENVLFIMNPLVDGNLAQGFITGNARFMGASLLHVVSSSAIGFAFGIGFYLSRFKKTLLRIAGVLIAIVLHTTFNFFIIGSNGSKTFLVFGFVWAIAIIVLLLFEKIKKLKPQYAPIKKIIL